MKCLIVIVTATLALCGAAFAQAPLSLEGKTVTLMTGAPAPVSLEGKTVTMMIGPPPGGGTDTAGRIIAQYLARHLPGSPNIVVQNMPGADGMVAMNYFVQHAKPDGQMIIMATGTQGDPLVYRGPGSHYDATRLAVVGGVGRGGTMLVIHKDAEPRLYDKSKPPVIMGAVAGVPRAGMQTTAWGIDLLGWNARWVVGYPGTNDLFVALQRGEIDMTASGNLFQVAKLLEGGKVKVLNQTGTLAGGKMVPRPEFADAPVFTNELQGKLPAGVQKQAFDYWFSLVVLDKWLALPEGTPEPVVQAYREAFDKMSKDAEFIARGKKMSEDFEPQAGKDVEELLKTLGNTTPEALDYIKKMLKGQGIG
jgi:tripartite-type tricarboxylate transporter receptor subunit TctC